jgi:Zn-dependent protease with chaperone function
VTSLDFLVLHASWAIPLALIPAGLHWWWTRSIVDVSASAVLPERLLAVSQRVSFVTILCALAIVAIARWNAVWILPLQFVAMTASTYRLRLALFAETWSFGSYLSWRLRLHIGLFGLWWLVGIAPAAVAEAGTQAQWWLAGLSVAIALAWHHWSGRVLLVLLRASPLDRPDLDVHFQRVFTSARVPTPQLWRAGVRGGVLANAFALVTLGERGVLFFDSLLDQLSAEEISAILAHEVAHLEQFHRRRVLVIYLVTSILIVLLLIGSAVVSELIPGFESWVWILSSMGVFAGIALRARRMQAHETDADQRAVELCGNPEALIRALTRIYEINHLPRRWSSQLEERATHPSLARRIRAIRGHAATPDTAPSPTAARVVVTSSEPGRSVVIDPTRIGFLWIDGGGESEDDLDRANRVEMVAYDQLRELRLAAKRGSIALVAVDRNGHRWSMPVHDADAERVQTALDLIDHLVVARPPARDFGMARRMAVLIVIVFAAPYNAIGAVLAPALLALRRPTRPLMLALAAALAATAIASVNEIDVSLVRVVLLTILTVIVVLSVRRPPQEEQPDAPHWTWIERAGLLAPVLIGFVFAAANAQDLFGLHSAVRDRSWFTAALAAVAVFSFVQTSERTSRRAGLGVAILATAALVIGSPWFLLHAVADPLIADMPLFRDTIVPVTTLRQQSVSGTFNSVRLTPDGMHFVLAGDYQEHAEYDYDVTDPQPPLRFVAGAFDGWQREIRAYDVAAIDDQRLLVLDRERGSSSLRAEDMRSGRVLWTITLPDSHLVSVQASPDGRWRAFARRRNQFERIEGRVGTSAVTSMRWTLDSVEASYLDVPRSDGGNGALAVASTFQFPTLTTLLTDLRETKRLLRVDASSLTEIATSNLRVECPPPPIDVTGSICVSYDGRSSRFWRVDLSSGQLTPLGEVRDLVWKLWQPSQQRLAGTVDGRPMLAALDFQTVITLSPDQRCWAQDIGVSRDVVVAACYDMNGTTVLQYRMPAGAY